MYLVKTLGISFVKCHFSYIYLFLHVLCAAGYFHSCVLKEFNNFSYLVAAACKGDTFCFVVQKVSVCFVLVG
jgi:hypothetical protein